MASPKAVVLVAGASSLWLVEEALRLHKSRLGECVVLDGWMDVLALKDELDEYKPSKVYLVFPGGEEGIEHLGSYEPGDPTELSPSELVRRIWLNLTGTMETSHYIEAFRLLAGYPFEAYRVGRRSLKTLLGNLCSSLPQAHTHDKEINE